MSLSENIVLQKYADSAQWQFSQNEGRLTKIGETYAAKIVGMTKGKVIGAVFGTLFWFLIFAIFYWYVKAYVNSALLIVSLAISFALLMFLLIDELSTLSYYKKIAKYQNRIYQLRNNVYLGKNSIRSNLDAFLNSRSDGWNYPFAVGPSIIEEVNSINNSITSIETLQNSFINRIKTWLFFIASILITVVGSQALFGIASEIMANAYVPERIVNPGELETFFRGTSSGDFLRSNTYTTLCVICMSVACIGEIFLAKLVWSKTDCTVKNRTIFVTIVGPVMFLVVPAVGTLIVMLVSWAARAAVAIAGICIIGAIMFALSSGG